MNVAIITDSFPPMMDGVSRSALGYANALHEGGYGKCIVIAPHIPRLKYNYPFPVYGFSSVKLPFDQYRAGHPFTPYLIRKLRSLDTDIIHAHSPFISMTLARELRRYLRIPIVFTQHTKWDYDIVRIISSKHLQKRIERFAYKNIDRADDVWAVSRGAGEYLCSRGFRGKYIVMPNGTDFPQHAAAPELLKQIENRFDLPGGVPVLLFVGRMMWYKNIELILESLEILRKRSFDFRMVFVGDGRDLLEVKKMTADKGLFDVVFFTGQVNDREMLRALYTRSDLFIFPSVYDTAGLVVLEAAACYSPSVVVRGSAASETVEDGVNGYYTSEDPENMADVVQAAFSDRRQLEQIAAAASGQIYLTWDKAIERAVKRYEAVKAAYAYYHV